jgi:hypothetical protein
VSNANAYSRADPKPRSALQPLPTDQCQPRLTHSYRTSLPPPEDPTLTTTVPAYLRYHRTPALFRRILRWSWSMP